MMKQIDLTHVIFDLDGTLLETLPSLTKCGNRMLTQLGLSEQSSDDYRLHVGYGARELVRRLIHAARSNEPDEAELDRALALYLELFAEDCTYEVRPYPGICDLLNGLSDRGVKMAVLTNKPHAMTLRVMRKAFPQPIFDLVQGQSDELPRKPDPRAAFDVARRIGAEDYSKVGFIGDSDTDMLTATRAGMVPIGVAWGFRSREELSEHGARLILEEPVDLLSVLAQSGK